MARLRWCSHRDLTSTEAMPFSPPAPAWFSITMDCPSNDAIFSVRTRLMKSDGPPAGKGTTNLMERFGNSSAASALDHARTPTKHKTRMSMDMQSRSLRSVPDREYYPALKGDRATENPKDTLDFGA